MKAHAALQMGLLLIAIMLAAGEDVQPISKASRIEPDSLEAVVGAADVQPIANANWKEAEEAQRGFGEVAESDLDQRLAEDVAIDAQKRRRRRRRGGGGLHVHHRHRPHLHHRHRPHVHVPHAHIQGVIDAVGDAFKKLGKEFEKLYNAFQDMFGSKFKLPSLTFGQDVLTGFNNGISTLTNGLADLMKNVKADQVLSMLETEAKTEEKWAAGGGYLAVKVGETAIIRPLVDAFCVVVKVFTDPIRKAFNGIMKMITGIIPSWLIRIAAFGGVGLLSFLFKAFSFGMGFSYTYGVTQDSFEAGFALEINDNLAIGKTGCYLGGSSGIDYTADLGFDGGPAITAFKEYGNIAGDSATLGVEGDICDFLGLPCDVKLSAAMIFDNSDWHNGESVALKTFKKCFGFGNNNDNLLMLADRKDRITHEMAVNMLQTKTQAEVKENILNMAMKFFSDGFGNLIDCIKAIFKLWIGLTMEATVGVSLVPTPTKGSFTLDYCYAND